MHNAPGSGSPHISALTGEEERREMRGVGRTEGRREMRGVDSREGKRDIRVVEKRDRVTTTPPGRCFIYNKIKIRFRYTC